MLVIELIVKECNLTTGIVRIGGRCQSTELEPFLLRHIKYKMRKEKTIASNIYNAILVSDPFLDTNLFYLLVRFETYNELSIIFLYNNS